MRLTVDRDSLADLVPWAARTLPSKATTQLQVLAGLLLEADGSALRVSAYDYEVATTGAADARVVEEGRALVNGKMLADLVKSLPKARVELAVDGTRLTITSGSASFKLPMLPSEDYPALPPMPDLLGTVDAGLFVTAVGQVGIAAGRDDTLPVLTGIRVEFSPKTITLAATDRYRLAVRTIPWEPAPDADLTLTLLIPARTLSDIARAAGEGRITIAAAGQKKAEGRGSGEPASAGFDVAGRQTTTRLIEGTFPPYRKLLPDSTPLIAEVEIPPLAAAVKRVALVASRTAPVQLTFAPGLLALEAGAGGEAQASETLAVAYDGPELKVSFNPAYLLDAAGAIEDDLVRFGFATEEPEIAAVKPAILTGKTGGDPAEIPDYRYLLMPIRLNG
ncbi:DNA polymerase III subunit beta [Parafrankia sp. EUN1f]|uniref:DNA polymerase III subunit beta n=1 Tax=Parafrankia sp. EUN1f TaxID=102897 RepID=UPI0001C46456|nr:DNA polymerase III subunit beta [Parafrankia sp. EUN1f]EFC80886.1 DNA polymerase III, beta subunit [Parafrankia sp. EUN1f]